jgi:hypothetical protein
VECGAGAGGGGGEASQRGHRLTGSPARSLDGEARLGLRRVGEESETERRQASEECGAGGGRRMD